MLIVVGYTIEWSNRILCDPMTPRAVIRGQRVLNSNTALKRSVKSLKIFSALRWFNKETVASRETKNIFILFWKGDVICDMPRHWIQSPLTLHCSFPTASSPTVSTGVEALPIIPAIKPHSLRLISNPSPRRCPQQWVSSLAPLILSAKLLLLSSVP